MSTVMLGISQNTLFNEGMAGSFNQGIFKAFSTHPIEGFV
jgi:hypothetical protein